MLTALKTFGNTIVTAKDSRPVQLCGVNRSGLEYSSPDAPGSLSKAGFSERELDEVAGWGANLLRLPFNQDWALARSSYDAEPYLLALDWIVEQAALRGIYTLLDLQWLDAVSPRGTLPNGSANFVPPLPNLESVQLWSQLAARYRNHTSVLFDIFNEPHDPLPDDMHELCGITSDGHIYQPVCRRVGMSQWQPWASHLIAAIRNQHPDALIFVSGVDWGYDLLGFPLPATENIVYSSHVYPSKKKRWTKAFGQLSRSHPVFLGEFGGVETDLDWGERLLDYLQARHIGWAAWSWSDHPHLIKTYSNFEPTAFGALVRAALRNHRSS
ncbi:MAG TPA: cellulase family glycosylhydrolase [Bryobacteraceae bacterium]|nr:cellulase family glycosylhydrolase [Bryobacteraceae bacterium]